MSQFVITGEAISLYIRHLEVLFDEYLACDDSNTKELAYVSFMRYFLAGYTLKVLRDPQDLCRGCRLHVLCGKAWLQYHEGHKTYEETALDFHKNLKEYLTSDAKAALNSAYEKDIEEDEICLKS